MARKAHNKKDRKKAGKKAGAKAATKGVLSRFTKPTVSSVTQVLINSSLQRVPDPLVELGFEAGHEPDTEAIRKAFREQLTEHPPEQEPEKATRLREARDRLLDPTRALERQLGYLAIPRAEYFGLPDLAAKESNPEPESNRVPSRPRLLGLLALYALIEEELEGPD